MLQQKLVNYVFNKLDSIEANSFKNKDYLFKLNKDAKYIQSTKFNK